MKTIISHLFIVAVLLSSLGGLQAQDVLRLKNGNNLKVKVQEITPQEIKYKKFDNLNGPLVTVLKTTVQSIKYENGTTEVLSEESGQVATTPAPTPTQYISTDTYGGRAKNGATSQPIQSNQPTQTYVVNTPTNQVPVSTQASSNYSDMYVQGQLDAKRYYRGYRGAGTGTFVTTLLIGPIVGLIPAIACSSSSPKQDRLGFPNMQLSQNSNYYTGYTQEARRIKSKKVWGNFGIATGIVVGLVIIAASASN